MKRLLKIIVKTEIFKDADIPELSNKCFFPRTSTIRNHIAHSKRRLYPSMIDQDCFAGEHEIMEVVTFFKPKTSFHYDGIIEKSPEDDSDIVENDDILLGKTETTPFHFVYQNGWQKRLFARYGNKLTLLDAAYRTTRYSLPLFSLVVKINIDYQMVAVFVTENETEESIEEALPIIKKWNETVSPMYGMTDYCVEEFNAMEKVFKGRC